MEKNFLTMPLPTVNRDLRVYVGDDRAGRAKNPKFAAQSVFVRRLTHSREISSRGLCSVVGQSSRCVGYGFVRCSRETDRLRPRLRQRDSSELNLKVPRN